MVHIARAADRFPVDRGPNDRAGAYTHFHDEVTGVVLHVMLCGFCILVGLVVRMVPVSITSGLMLIAVGAGGVSRAMDSSER
jgi:hypothetical protein